MLVIIELDAFQRVGLYNLDLFALGGLKIAMFSFVKKGIIKLLFKEKADSESYIRYLRKLGMRIGNHCIIYEPRMTVIDITRPWLISIGDNVKITIGVTILTHGYDWSVLKNLYGDVLGSSGKVHIGNNVFIGMNTTILKGVTIGDNVIIGANSLVNKSIPDNTVAAGNPVRIIMNIDEYYEKRKKAQYSEAHELVEEYRKTYGKEVDDYELREFFWLFENNPSSISPVWRDVMRLNGTESISNKRMKEHTKMFDNREAFLESIE